VTELLVVIVTGLLVIAAATLAGPRLGIAAPLVLVAIGVGASFLPVFSSTHIEPEWILEGVLPPLLYSSAVSMPAMNFRREFSAISGLSVVLVVGSVSFVASVPAGLLGASGLVAAVVAGLITGVRAPRDLSAQNRLSDSQNWRTVELVLEGAVFLTMGVQIKAIVTNVEHDHAGVARAVLIAAGALGLTVLVRAAYVGPLLWFLARQSGRREKMRIRVAGMRERMGTPDGVRETFSEVNRRKRVSERDLDRFTHRVAQVLADIEYFLRDPLGWREGTAVVWAGMRGAVTVAAAAAAQGGRPAAVGPGAHRVRGGGDVTARPGRHDRTAAAPDHAEGRPGRGRRADRRRADPDHPADALQRRGGAGAATPRAHAGGVRHRQEPPARGSRGATVGVARRARSRRLRRGRPGARAGEPGRVADRHRDARLLTALEHGSTLILEQRSRQPGKDTS
jgi:hypothetical protein